MNGSCDILEVSATPSNRILRKYIYDPIAGWNEIEQNPVALGSTCTCYNCLPKRDEEVYYNDDSSGLDFEDIQFLEMEKRNRVTKSSKYGYYDSNENFY